MLPTDANELIEHIKKFFLEGKPYEPGKEEIWWVLSAMRGPDNEAPEMKRATTAVIRWKLFGPYALGDSNPDDEEAAKFRRGLFMPVDSHFVMHARMAFKVLDLRWNEVNP